MIISNKLSSHLLTIPFFERFMKKEEKISFFFSSDDFKEYPVLEFYLDLLSHSEMFELSDYDDAFAFGVEIEDDLFLTRLTVQIFLDEILEKPISLNSSKEFFFSFLERGREKIVELLYFYFPDELRFSTRSTFLNTIYLPIEKKNKEEVKESIEEYKYFLLQRVLDLEYLLYEIHYAIEKQIECFWTFQIGKRKVYEIIWKREKKNGETEYVPENLSICNFTWKVGIDQRIDTISVISSNRKPLKISCKYIWIGNIEEQYISVLHPVNKKDMYIVNLPICLLSKEKLSMISDYFISSSEVEEVLLLEMMN